MKTSAMLTAIALVLTLLSFSPTFVFAAPLTGTGLELALNATAIAAYSNAVAELKARVAMMIPSNGALNDHPLSDSTESWGDPKKAVIAICADVTWQNCAYPAVTDKQCQEVCHPFTTFVPYVLVVTNHDFRSLWDGWLRESGLGAREECPLSSS